MYSNSINNILVMLAYCCKTKLLINRTKNDQFCKDNEENILFH